MKRCFGLIQEKNQKGKKGFTLMETLVTVAIIAILCAVVFVAATSIKKNVEQKRLDTIAQDIYVAAQNQLTGLYTDSRINFLNPDTAPAGMGGDLFKLVDNSASGGPTYRPSDWDDTTAGAYVPLTALDNSSAAAAVDFSYKVLMPEGILSQEVYEKFWIIEYNPDFGYVYGVYYMDTAAAFTPASASVAGWYAEKEAGVSYADFYRSYGNRKGSGIGYYGGGGVLGNKVQLSNTALNAAINVENAEELQTSITIKVPTEFKDYTVRLTYTIKGLSSGEEYPQVVYLGTDAGYFTRVKKLTLDSLKDGAGFKDLFVNGTYHFFPGEDLELTLLAELGELNGATFTASDADTASAAVTFNSLFESLVPEVGGKYTASVAYGRHLQNLQEADYANLNITGAVQTKNIDFAYTTPEDNTDALQWWAETYSNVDAAGNILSLREFEPLDVTALMTYDGGNYTITGLTAGWDSTVVNAGLFGTFYGEKIQNIGLVGTKVNGTNAGALIGKAANAVTLENCGAYLERSHYYGYTYNSIPYRISGSSNAGGLVGTASSDVTANLCFAAEVVDGGNSAKSGGLFGNVAGTMKLTHSYSDSYIFGSTIGGLAGGCGSSSEISACYAAGFTANNAAAVSAGFVPGSVSRVSNSYTIFNLGADYAGTKKVATVTNGTLTRTYYIGENVDKEIYQNSEVVIEDSGIATSYTNLRSTALKAGGASSTVDLKTEDGFSFEPNTTRTTAYNLAEGLGLTVYPYPIISAAEDGGTTVELRHYGDWDGSAFDPGTLVYFEEYENTKEDGTKETIRGYYGAGSNYLRDDLPVLRDGYALLYLGDDGNFAKNDTLKVTFEGQDYTIAKADDQDCYTVITKAFNGTLREARYYFRDLPYDSIVNSEKAVNRLFYSPVTVTRTEATEGAVPVPCYYYFNPLFAATVVQVDTEDAEAPTLKDSTSYTITIRTPRQLNLLSRYFNTMDTGYLEKRVEDGTYSYVSIENKVVYGQELDLDYTKYQWQKAGYDAVVKNQAPIADSTRKPFLSTYDGMYHVITGVNLKSETLFTGLFGCNAGRLRNIVIGAQEKDQYVVGYSVAPNRANSTAYAGGLAGYNVGSVNNCAVAGYRMEAFTYNSTTLNAGGLAGYNNGTITASSADVPSIKVETNRSNGSLGVFVGVNGGRGVINYSYSVGYMNARRYTSGTVRAAGFAGSNSGIIQNSYTASAMTVSNIESRYLDAFAPSGGNVRNCYFLSDGSYKYCDNVYAYNQLSVTASNVTYDDLKAGAVNLPNFGTTDAIHSYYCGSTNMVGGTANYPFRTAVRNKAGEAVHYGDWPSTDIFGEFGMLYWEHEEKGANNGYHFYLVDLNGNEFSTLCEAHDDGGVITEYGYGYYSLTDKATTANFHDVELGTENTAAEADFAAQFAGTYRFTLYTTTNAFDSKLSGMYLINAKSHANLNLACDGKNLDYYFSPFFGAAISMDESEFPADVSLQVRSIDQLQFINWNNSKGSMNNSSLVGKTNYGSYTYLAYTKYPTGNARQTKANAQNPDALNTTWKQSHDIDMSSVESVSFTPIAGAATSADNGGYNATLYTWFGGTYDGQSYKIQELSMKSSSFTVGLFGVTAGAQIQNVILYSEKGASIVRETKSSDALGAYTLGGLIGVAYDYDVRDAYGNRIPSTLKITNCAIAGYKIVDNSKNQQGQGEANVGGLIGVANVNLEKCSAVTDIEINCTHLKSENDVTKGITTATFGNFVRVGGVTGATQGYLDDCYSGGSISVGAGTLNENYTNGGKYVNYNDRTNETKGMVVDAYHSTNVYIAGIAGSGFAMNYQNFTNETSLKEGSPTFENCYTYITFPKLEGTIRSISIIGSLADRYDWGVYYKQSVYITNCYYLGAIIDKSFMTSNLPVFKNTNNGENGGPSIDSLLKNNNSNYGNYDYFNEMLHGTSIYTNRLYNKGNKSGIKIDELTERSFTQMSELAASLNKNKRAGEQLWTYVTIDENGSTINGKYSFPAGVPNLKGLNYPFPTIVTQWDNTFNRTVNVHYGEWPKENGIYTSSANVDLDLLTVGKDSADVTLTYYKEYKETSVDSLDQLVLTYVEGEDNTTPSAVSNLVKVTPSLNDNGTVKLSMIGLSEGSVTVQIQYTDADGKEHTASIQVTVTADFSITAEPVTVSVDTSGAETLVPVPDGTTLETFQGDKLYWKLSAANSSAERIVLEPQNWDVLSGFDENFDTYTIRKIGSDVVLEFDSRFVGSHTIQVGAFGLFGVSNGLNGITQKVAGTRNTELTFEVLKNPAAVKIYQEPAGTSGNTLLGILYIGESDYYADKKCTIPVTVLDKSWFAPRTGYTFDGFKTADGTITFAEYNPENPSANLDTEGNLKISYREIFSGIGVTGNISVYGNWTANVYHLTLSYQDTTADKSKTYDVTYGSAVVLEGYDSEEYPNNEGRIFGWYDTETIDANSAPILSRNGTFTPAATEKGYLTDGKWSVDHDVTLYGHEADVQYTLNLDPNYGEETVTTHTFGYSEPGVVLPTETNMLRTGYQFAGWFTAPDGGEQVTGTVDKAAATTSEPPTPLYDLNNGILEVTLYAHWTANSYTVQFNANGSGVTGTMADQSFVYDTAKVLSANTYVRDGYQFLGWNTAADGTGDPYADQATVINLSEENSAVVTLYAQWAKWYTIRYVDENGNEYTNPSLNQMYLETADSITLAGTPTSAPVGGTFAGWTVDSATVGTWTNGTVYSAGQTIGQPISGDVTLKATWSYYKLTLSAKSANNYSAKFDSGVIKGLTQLPTADSATVYTAPTRRGWTLQGWYYNGTKILDADGKVAANVAGITVDGKFDLNNDYTLVAKWKRQNKIYTLTPVQNPLSSDTVLITNSDGTYALSMDEYSIFGNTGYSYSSIVLNKNTVEGGWKDSDDVDMSGFYMDSDVDSSLKWTVGTSTSSYSFMNIKYSRYLSRYYNSLSSTQNGTSSAIWWSYGNNSLYYTTKDWYGRLLYCSLDVNNVQLSNTSSESQMSKVYFYTVESKEVYSYD